MNSFSFGGLRIANRVALLFALVLLGQSGQGLIGAAVRVGVDVELTRASANVSSSCEENDLGSSDLTKVKQALKTALQERWPFKLWAFQIDEPGAAELPPAVVGVLRFANNRASVGFKIFGAGDRDKPIKFVPTSGSQVIPTVYCDAESLSRALETALVDHAGDLEALLLEYVHVGAGAAKSPDGWVLWAPTSAGAGVFRYRGYDAGLSVGPCSRRSVELVFEGDGCHKIDERLGVLVKLRPVANCNADFEPDLGKLQHSVFFLNESPDERASSPGCPVAGTGRRMIAATVAAQEE